MRWLLLAALGMLGLMVAGVVLLLRVQRQQKALEQRIARVSTKGRRVAAAPAPLVRAEAKATRSPAAILGTVIGYDQARRDQYGLPWWAIMGGALLLGRIAVMLASGLAGSGAWVLLPIVTLFASRRYYGRADAKRRTLLLKQFPDALSLIVRAVRVGIPVTECLKAVSREAPEPTRTEFDRLSHQIAIGTTLEAALRAMASRNTLPEYGFFAAAVALQAQTGGGLTETLETLADIIRKRLAMKLRGHALSSEARTTALVLSILPFVAGGMLFAVSPAYIGLLFSEHFGHTLLGVAVLCLVVGTTTMRVIINKSLS